MEGEGAHVLVAVILCVEPCYSHSRFERLNNAGQGLLCELVAFEFGVQLVAIWFESHRQRKPQRDAELSARRVKTGAHMRLTRLWVRARVKTMHMYIINFCA